MPSAHNSLLAAQIAAAEARNAEKVREIPDEFVEHQGGGVFKIKGSNDAEYWVDIGGRTPYAVCSCKNWHLSNPTRNKEQGFAIRCKHILKAQVMVNDGKFATATPDVIRKVFGEDVDR